MSQTDTIKSKFLKNPILFISILQIVMLILPGYVAKDEFVGDSVSKSLFKAAFDSVNAINVLFQTFIVLAPIATLVCFLVKKSTTNRVQYLELQLYWEL